MLSLGTTAFFAITKSDNKLEKCTRGLGTVLIGFFLMFAFIGLCSHNTYSFAWFYIFSGVYLFGGTIYVGKTLYSIGADCDSLTELWCGDSGPDDELHARRSRARDILDQRSSESNEHSDDSLGAFRRRNGGLDLWAMRDSLNRNILGRELKPHEKV